MKYKYTVFPVKIGPHEKLVINLLDEYNIPTVNTLLNSDIGPGLSGEHAIDLINKVLENRSEKEIWSFNACTIYINKDFTKIVNRLVDEDQVDESVIETEELKDLIEAWILEKKKY